MQDRREMPKLLMALLIFSWASLIVSVGSLGLAFAGFSTLDALVSEYTGPWGWMPYLWVALVVTGSARTGHRMHAVSFARAVLVLGMAMGVVDLAMNGWARQGSGSVFVYSPWRFAWSWVIPGTWLGLLQSRRVRSWATAALTETDATTATPKA